MCRTSHGHLKQEEANTKFTLGHYEYIFKYFICFPRGALKCINFKSHLVVITINLNL